LRPQRPPAALAAQRRTGSHPEDAPQVKENAEMRMDVALLFCLKQFVRIKTVSGDPALAEECFRGAKYLAGLLESLGAEVKLAMSADSVHPVVLGRIVTCPSRPTVMFYGHYDVQPAHELVRPGRGRAGRAGSDSGLCAMRGACCRLGGSGRFRRVDTGRAQGWAQSGGAAAGRAEAARKTVRAHSARPL